MQIVENPLDAFLLLIVQLLEWRSDEIASHSVQTFERVFHAGMSILTGVVEDLSQAVKNIAHFSSLLEIAGPHGPTECNVKVSADAPHA